MRIDPDYLTLPNGVAYKADGSGFTTDAAEALEGGAIATFGGHKGAGLALCVELLAGALSGGAVVRCCRNRRSRNSRCEVVVIVVAVGGGGGDGGRMGGTG
jgi:LDH2 family malate/lactate/ureidoglycolate dehydrogenase